MPDINAATRSKYLDSNKNVSIQKHLDQLDKEEKSGLKGIEIREKAKELGKDDFLKILITQLSQQDPTNPMKDQDFIAQMAQFSSLEQMKNISSGIARMEAKQSYSVVGKLISGPDLVTGEDVVGIAAAIFFDAEGKTYVRVNGRTIDVEKINLISDPNVLEDRPNSPTRETISNHSGQSQPSFPMVSADPVETLGGRKGDITGLGEISGREGMGGTDVKHSLEMEIPGYRPLTGGKKNNPYEDQVFIQNDER